VEGIGAWRGWKIQVRRSIIPLLSIMECAASYSVFVKAARSLSTLACLPWCLSDALRCPRTWTIPLKAEDVSKGTTQTFSAPSLHRRMRPGNLSLALSPSRSFILSFRLSLFLFFFFSLSLSLSLSHSLSHYVARVAGHSPRLITRERDF
jgi:hypothetical protein